MNIYQIRNVSFFNHDYRNVILSGDLVLLVTIKSPSKHAITGHETNNNRCVCDFVLYDTFMRLKKIS